MASVSLSKSACPRAAVFGLVAGHDLHPIRPRAGGRAVRGAAVGHRVRPTHRELGAGPGSRRSPCGLRRRRRRGVRPPRAARGLHLLRGDGAVRHAAGAHRGGDQRHRDRVSCPPPPSRFCGIASASTSSRGWPPIVPCPTWPRSGPSCADGEAPGGDLAPRGRRVRRARRGAVYRDAGVAGAQRDDRHRHHPDHRGPDPSGMGGAAPATGST